MLNAQCVLTIDDSDTIRAYLRNVLTPLVVTVEGAATGQEGLKKCAEGQYDLVLLDLMLPDIDGIAVLEQIREKNDESTVVMLTSHGGIKSAIAAVQRGADGYIQKQDITASSDHAEFLYALEQAASHRAGIMAQKQLEQVRADFYSMVTHDLRNPTSLILNATEMLVGDGIGSLTSEQQELVSIVQGSADKLSRLINDYLDFSKIDAGYLRLDLGEVDLRQIVEASTHPARLQARVRQQALILDLPPDPVPACADAERLKQVLDNLLSNAMKYTPEGGHVTVQLRAQDGLAVFRVSDTGMGIPPEQLSALFTKYHRVPGEATRGIRGTGLGLLIVKEISEAHGGAVHAKSEGVPGKGTTFVVSIPLAQEAKAARPEDTWLQASSLPEQVAEDTPLDLTAEIEIHDLFREESQKHILTLQDTLSRLYGAPQDQPLIEKARFASHALKGNSGALHLTAICESATQMDNVFGQAAKGALVLTTTHVRDLTQLLDRITDALVSEQPT